MPDSHPTNRVIHDPTARRPRPKRPADAASLVVLNQERGAVSVLMGQRSARHRFMPRALVFPGGRLDRGDHAAAAPSVGGLAPGFAAAALRETEEETGLAAQPGAPLSYLCRLVTPAYLPIRFDARFLVAEATWFSGALAGSGELEFLRFIPLGEVATLELSQPTRLVLEELTLWLSLDEQGRAGHVAGTWRHRAGYLRRNPPGQLALRKVSGAP
jgi:8-oxo-dGTP pyrophosphatase MutT (NUDIX family)